MKKLLWLDINASYSHSSFALPAIHAQDKDECRDIEWHVVSDNINTNINSVVARVAEQNPDIIAATAWLFTHEYLTKVIVRVKALIPNCIIILGGPEFLGKNEKYLSQNNYVSCVFRGEGEHGFWEWLKIHDQPEKWGTVAGLCYLDSEKSYHDNGICKVKNFVELNPPTRSQFFDSKKPFIQFETTRGCFNSCAFCVSGDDKPIRELPMSLVRERLNEIRELGIRDIRMLDRTFNGNTKRAVEMLNLFMSFPDMKFHLEIHPALLKNEIRQILKTVPQGLLHLEAGIQSLNDEVLSKCGRIGSLDAALDGLRFLCSLSNMETHIDLIAGLPLYTLENIFSDIRTLSDLKAKEIQLELLKVLPGTAMRRDADVLGVIYSPIPPYEVLRTSDISIKELYHAKLLSRLIDAFYNTNAWQSVMQTAIDSNHMFLKDFLEWLTPQKYLEQPLSIEKRGLILFQFCEAHYPNLRIEVAKAWVAAGLTLRKEPGQFFKANI